MRGPSEPVTASFAPSGFFVLRTPLLPRARLLEWTRAPGEADRDALQRAATSPEVLEALSLSSPELVADLDHWRRAPDSERGRKVERSVLRYLYRTASRATPYGLFAGCSLGTVTSTTPTVLALSDRQDWQKRATLSAERLAQLTFAVVSRPEIRPHLRLRANDTLYRVGDAWRYLETRRAGIETTFRLTAADSDAFLEQVLETARRGASFDSLVTALRTLDAELGDDDIREYLNGLFDAELLVPELGVGATRSDLLPEVGRVLDQANSELAAPWQTLTQQVASVGVALGQPAGAYDGVASAAAALVPEVTGRALLAVDLYKPGGELRLCAQDLETLVPAVSLMSQLRAPVRRLTRFHAAMERKFERREVPLLAALDEEIGVGVPDWMDAASEAPAANTLPLGGAGGPGERGSGMWPEVEDFLLEALQTVWRTGQSTLELDARRLEAVVARRPKVSLPDAFNLRVSLTGAASGPKWLLHGGFGPSGAQQIGRFCTLDPALEAAVRAHVEREEQTQPDAVFAEVAHLPGGRGASIAVRPALRRYEIACLGATSTGPEETLTLDDLLVSAQPGELVLRSRRLGRRVYPRVSSAHNFMAPGMLHLYRFLGMLQLEGTADMKWSWGRFASARSLPRVVLGEVILAPARWHFAADVFAGVSQSDGAALNACVQRLRNENRLPRFVAVSRTGDEESLTCDLDNPLSVTAAFSRSNERQAITCTELIPAVGDEPVRAPDGGYAHELLIPFLRSDQAPRAADRPAERKALATRRLTYPPGSEWLYVRVGCVPAVQDRLLAGPLQALVAEGRAEGRFDRWFFIRFDDPEPHLRLRFHGPAETLLTGLLPRLTSALQPSMDAGLVSRIAVDTYEPELDRYGGEEAMPHAEQLFDADSEAMLALVSAPPSERWKLGVPSANRLLADLGLSEEERLIWAERARSTFAREFEVDAAFGHAMGRRFREHRAELQALLDGDGSRRDHASVAAVLSQRTQESAAAAQALRALAARGALSVTVPALGTALVHMTLNRLLRTGQRAQELVIYDLLTRLYESKLARARRR